MIRENITGYKKYHLYSSSIKSNNEYKLKDFQEKLSKMKRYNLIGYMRDSKTKNPWYLWLYDVFSLSIKEVDLRQSNNSYYLYMTCNIEVNSNNGKITGNGIKLESIPHLDTTRMDINLKSDNSKNYINHWKFQNKDKFMCVMDSLKTGDFGIFVNLAGETLVLNSAEVMKIMECGSSSFEIVNITYVKIESNKSNKSDYLMVKSSITNMVMILSHYGEVLDYATYISNNSNRDRQVEFEIYSNILRLNCIAWLLNIMRFRSNKNKPIYAHILESRGFRVSNILKYYSSESSCYNMLYAIFNGIFNKTSINFNVNYNERLDTIAIVKDGAISLDANDYLSLYHVFGYKLGEFIRSKWLILGFNLLNNINTHACCYSTSTKYDHLADFSYDLSEYYNNSSDECGKLKIDLYNYERNFEISFDNLKCYINRERTKSLFFKADSISSDYYTKDGTSDEKTRMIFKCDKSLGALNIDITIVVDLYYDNNRHIELVKYEISDPSLNISTYNSNLDSLLYGLDYLTCFQHGTLHKLREKLECINSENSPVAYDNSYNIDNNSEYTNVKINDPKAVAYLRLKELSEAEIKKLNLSPMYINRLAYEYDGSVRNVGNYDGINFTAISRLLNREVITNIKLDDVEKFLIASGLPVISSNSRYSQKVIDTLYKYCKHSDNGSTDIMSKYLKPIDEGLDSTTKDSDKKYIQTLNGKEIEKTTILLNDSEFIEVFILPSYSELPLTDAKIKNDLIDQINKSYHSKYNYFPIKTTKGSNSKTEDYHIVYYLMYKNGEVKNTYVGVNYIDNNYLTNYYDIINFIEHIINTGSPMGRVFNGNDSRDSYTLDNVPRRVYDILMNPLDNIGMVPSELFTRFYMNTNYEYNMSTVNVFSGINMRARWNFGYCIISQKNYIYVELDAEFLKDELFNKDFENLFEYKDGAFILDREMYSSSSKIAIPLFAFNSDDVMEAKMVFELFNLTNGIDIGKVVYSLFKYSEMSGINYIKNLNKKLSTKQIGNFYNFLALLRKSGKVTDIIDKKSQLLELIVTTLIKDNKSLSTKNKIKAMVDLLEKIELDI